MEISEPSYRTTVCSVKWIERERERKGKTNFSLQIKIFQAIEAERIVGLKDFNTLKIMKWKISLRCSEMLNCNYFCRP